MDGDIVRWGFTVLVVLWAAFVFWQLTDSIQEGAPWRAAAWCWLASPFPMFFVAGGIEGRRLSELFDIRTQSWAFLLGDTVFLPFMAAMLALAWRQISLRQNPASGIWYKPVLPPEKKPWYTTSAWRVSAGAIGLAAGVVFHLVDMANYTDLAANSPAKLMHDYGAYPTLWGGLWFGLWPALYRRPSRKWALVALVGWSLWLAAGIADNTVHHLDGRNLHVQFDWDTHLIIPY